MMRVPGREPDSELVALIRRIAHALRENLKLILVGVIVVVALAVTYESLRFTATPPPPATTALPPPADLAPPPADLAPPPSGHWDGISSEVPVTAGPFWNTWIEAASPEPTFQPIPGVPPKDDFRLVVDLSLLQLKLRAITSREIGPRLQQWLSSEHDPMPALEVLVIPDPKAFHLAPNEIRLKSFPLNLKPLREGADAPAISTQAALQKLRLNRGKAPFDLGNVSFVLSAGNAVGSRTIGLMFWAHKKNVGRVPVGEMAIQVCISATPDDDPNCPRDSTDTGSAGLLLSGATRGLPADGAFDVVELDDDNVIGTFRCNGCRGWGPDEILSWRLANNMSTMAAYISTTLKVAFEHAADANHDPGRGTPNWDGYERAGRDLYNMLFASPDDSDNASLVQTRLTALMEDQVQKEKTGGTSVTPKIILFRMLSKSPSDFPVLPLNLLAVPLPDGTSEYLGAHFRIRQALYYPSQRAPRTCVSSWRVLVPPADLADPIATDARPQVAQWIASFQPAEVSQDLLQFGKWLDPVILADSAAVTTAPAGAALVVLSHHEGNRLFFDSKAQEVGINSQGITRYFGNPSAAIIDACGAADPKAFDIMQQLNRHGVSAIIASTTKVDAVVGGKFLSTLLDVASSHTDSAGYSLQRARFEAARQLSQDRRIGPQTLSFGYFGDDDIAICVPPKITADLP